MTDLTPEQEALVPEVSRALFKALTGGHAGTPKLIDLAAARAIIPLIYTAGRRAGREEAAKVADPLAAYVPWPQNHPLSGGIGERMAKAKAVAAHEIGEAIRSLSEQESGR